MASEGGNTALTSDTRSEGGEPTPGPASKRPRTAARTTAPRKGHPLDINFGGTKIKGTLGERCAVVNTGAQNDYRRAFFIKQEQNKPFERAYLAEELQGILHGKRDILERRVTTSQTAEIKAALQKLLKEPVIDDKSLAAIQAMVPDFEEDPVVRQLRDALEEGRRAQATLDAMRSALKDLVKCPITLDTLVDPATCIRCGKTVSEGALFEALRNNTDPCCPLCRAPTKLSLRDCSCGAETHNIHGHSDECRDGMVMATIRGGSFASNRLANELIEMLPSQEAEPDRSRSPTLL